MLRVCTAGREWHGQRSRGERPRHVDVRQQRPVSSVGQHDRDVGIQQRGRVQAASAPHHQRDRLLLTAAADADADAFEQNRLGAVHVNALGVEEGYDQWLK